jgi:hypothetical protein
VNQVSLTSFMDVGACAMGRFHVPFFKFGTCRRSCLTNIAAVWATTDSIAIKSRAIDSTDFCFWRIKVRSDWTKYLYAGRELLGIRGLSGIYPLLAKSGRPSKFTSHWISWGQERRSIYCGSSLPAKGHERSLGALGRRRDPIETSKKSGSASQ